MFHAITPEKLEEQINRFFEEIENEGFIINECKTHWDPENRRFIADVLYGEETVYSLKRFLNFKENDKSEIITEIGEVIKEYLNSLDVGYLIQEFLERSGIDFDIEKIIDKITFKKK